MRAKRGFLLITALLITTLLMLLGMGMLGSQSSRYEAVKQSALSSQARQLALAGLEDARIKLEMDVEFPPDRGPGQTQFSYSERLNDGTIQGTYSVTIDQSHAAPPSEVIIVVAVGSVGSLSRPVAQYKLRAELDLRRVGRPSNGAGVSPARHFVYTHIQDEEMP